MLTWYKPAAEGVTPAYNTSVFANVMEPMVTCMSPAIELAAPGSCPAAKLGLVRPRPVAYRVSTSPGLAGAKVLLGRALSLRPAGTHARPVLQGRQSHRSEQPCPGRMVGSSDRRHGPGHLAAHPQWHYHGPAIRNVTL